jgi:hypothetical protein
MSGSSGRASPERAGESPSDNDRAPLLDHETRAEAVEGAEPFGRPRRPCDRRSPFRSAFLAGLGLAAACVVAWAVFNSREVLLLIGLAFMFSVGLDPVVTLLARRGVPRPLAVLLVSVSAFAVFAGFLALAIPPLVDEVGRLAAHAPHYLHTLSSRGGRVRAGLLIDAALARVGG